MLRQILPSSRKNYAGQTARRLRIEREMSERDVVKELQLLGWDVDQSTYHNIEVGKRRLYDYEIVLLCETFKVSLEEFMNYNTKEKP